MNIIGNLRPSPFLWAVEPAAGKLFVCLVMPIKLLKWGWQVRNISGTMKGMLSPPFWSFERFDLSVPHGELELSYLLVWQDKGKVKEITTLIEEIFVQRGDSKVDSTFPWTHYSLLHTPWTSGRINQYTELGKGWLPWRNKDSKYPMITETRSETPESLTTSLPPSNLLCSVESHLSPNGLL